MRTYYTLASTVSVVALSIGFLVGGATTPALASTGCDSVGAEPAFTYTGPTGGSNSFSQQLQGGANFTFNPGDVVTLTITVPPLSRIDIAFAGGVGSVNNSGGGTPLTQTLTFTVPDSGGPSSGTFTISGSVVGTNTATIAFACVNADQNNNDNDNAGATNANQAAATTDTTLQSVVPGGLNGDIFAALNIPTSDHLFGTFEGREVPVSQNDDAAFRAKMELRKQQLEVEADRLRQEVLDSATKDVERSKQLQEENSALRQQREEISEENRQDAIRETQGALEQNAQDQQANKDAIAAKQEEIDNSLKPINDILDGRELDELSDEERAKVVELSKDLAQKSEEDVPRLKQELQELEARSDQLVREQEGLQQRQRGLESDNFAISTKDAEKNDADPRIQEINQQLDANIAEENELRNPVSIDPDKNPLVAEGGRLEQERQAVSDFLSGDISRDELENIQNDLSHQRQDALGLQQIPTRGVPVANFFPALPDLNQVHARFNLAAERRAIAAKDGLAALPDGLLGDDRFNLWFGADITLHRDRRSIGQEGESLAADGGVSYLIEDDLNLGLAARYAHTDTEGDTGETISDTYTLSVFAQKQIFDDAVIEAVIAYSLVDLDLTFKNAGTVTSTGSTDATSLAAQTRISQQFALDGGWWMVPNLGASVVTTERDAFTTSDGTLVGESRSTQVALVGGPTVGTSWTVKGGGINYSDLQVSPSFGLSANYNLGRFDRVVDANNNVFETDRFGLSASAGVGFGFGRGANLSFNANYAGIAADQQNLTFGARLNLPFN